MLNSTENVLKALNDLSLQQQTGTFFITTAENKACHILFESGRITALSYGRFRGEQVVPQLSEMDVERYSFMYQTKMPLAGRSFVDDEFDVIAALGFTRDNDMPAEQHTMVYRGQTLTVETAEEKLPSAEPRKKPVRIYRGRRVQD